MPHQTTLTTKSVTRTTVFFSCFALFPLDNVVIKIDGDTILHASSYLFSPIKPSIPSYKYSQFNYCVQLHKLLTYSTVENYT